MKTLGKQFTNQIFISQEAYSSFRYNWSKRMQDKQELDSWYHTTFLILAGKDWRKGYAPTSDFYTVYNDLNKIYSVLQYDGYYRQQFKKLFGESFTTNFKEILLKVIPKHDEITETAIQNKTLPEYKETMSGVS